MENTKLDNFPECLSLKLVLNMGCALESPEENFNVLLIGLTAPRPPPAPEFRFNWCG